MKKFLNTNGYEYELIDSKGDYSLLRAINNRYTPWVVTWKLNVHDGKITWGQGYYYQTEEEARRKLKRA